MRLSRCLKIRRSVFAPFAAAIAFLMPAVTEAQGGPGEDPVVKIEEDWIAMVSESDAEVSAPQMATTFVPDAAVPDQQFSLLLNQHQSPEPEGGGMQVVWNEGEATPYLSVPTWHGSLDEGQERITWTQQVFIENGSLTFRVMDGVGLTWQLFGHADGLSLSVPTSLENLASYDPALSQGKADVVFASNRVSTFGLRRVRYYHASGSVDTVRFNLIDSEGINWGDD